jgi:hypothetical protein
VHSSRPHARATIVWCAMYCTNDALQLIIGKVAGVIAPENRTVTGKRASSFDSTRRPQMVMPTP